MNEQKSSEKSSPSNNFLVFLSVGILVVFLALVGGVYWWVSTKSKGQIVFPAGINYTGNETPAPTQQPQRPQYDYTEMAAASDWVDFTSPKGQYIFKYPPEMIPLIFPGDVNDAVTFDISDIPAQFNLMVLVETISSYDAKLRGKPEEFVRNYWNFFGGLKGLNDIETFQTDKGLQGWKARYVTQTDALGTDNYFFTIAGQNDKILHVNNIFPADGQAVFTRLLNSLEYKK